MPTPTPVDGIITGLFIRRLGQFESSLVPATEGASSPMFSPDGQWVAFFSRAGGAARLLKVNLETNAPPTLLTELVDDWLDGGHWLDDGTILFSQPRRGLRRVPDNGGESSELTAKSAEDTDHHNPVMLPGGETVLFTRS